MSRRKQAKPQHLRTDGGAPGSGAPRGGGVMESMKTDVPNRSCHSSEETHICDKCCADFFTLTELSEHHKVCTEDPLVLIVKENERMPVQQKSSTRSSPVPSIESSDLSSAESTDASFELSHTVVSNGSVDNLEEGPDLEEVAVLDRCPRDKQALNCSPRPPDTAESSSLLMSPASTYSMPTTNVTLEILHSTRVAVAQFSQGLYSCGSGGKVASVAIPVILEHLLTLQQQQIHQLQLIEQICSQVTSMNKNVPQVGLKPVYSSLSVSPNPFPSQELLTPSVLPQTGTLCSTIDKQAAVSLSSVPEQSQSPPVQIMSGKHTFRDVTGTSFSSENVAPSLTDSSTSSSSNTYSQTNNTGCILSTPSPLSLEQRSLLSSSSSLPFPPQSSPNPLASITATANALNPLAALLKHRKGKLPNISLFKAKLSPEEPFFKHKCRFCAKVFGSDSALQIHLRSHTGERPFKCNICGNRFSTKGNLKVHFQRHKDKYPHVQMNPYPVPEYLDNVPTSSGIPYGMSIPSEKTVFSWLDNKPVERTLPATMGLPLSTTMTSTGGSNDSASAISPNKSAYQQAPLECVGFSLNHRGNESVSVSLQSSQEKEASDIDKTEGAYLQQNCSLRSNLITKATISSIPSLATTCEPFTSMSLVSCSSAHSVTSDESKQLADSMQTSETSKLQQLVEKIDKKVTDPNQCSLCNRVLSCQSALKMHYRIHTGERPYKCKVCGRAFTTKGNLKAHIGIHRENPPVHVQHSCPICQKKFTNAIVLQQHIRMHMIGQIPDSTYGDGLQEMDINASVNERNIISLGSNSNDTDDISMDEEEDEEEEGMGEGIKPSKPLVPGCGCPNSSTNISSITALENQMKMVDLTVGPSNASGVKPLTNHFNDSCQLNSKCNLSEKRVENCSEIILNMSGFYSSPSSSMSLIQRNSENSMIRPPDAYNRPDSNEPIAVSVKKEQSESTASSAADAMSQDVTGILARKLDVKEKALFNRAFQQSREQVTAQNNPKLTSNSSAPGLGKTEVNGHIQGTKISEGKDPQFAVHVPPTYTSVSSPGMTLLLGPAHPRRTPKHHNCDVCGKNFSSASALQIHERTHTGEKPFVCSICGRAFTTKGNLKVHMGTHMWNNAPSRRGRRLSVENPMALLGGEYVKFGEMAQKDLAVRAMKVDPGFWNRYATTIASSLATKNEISMFHSSGISQLHTLTAGAEIMTNTGGPINKTSTDLGNNGHFSLLIEDSKEIEIN
ncbi:sal-like protein 3 [Takifugu flavidus]|uniref:sal-like protein 3 n=1 Tax=Takifugu flavidus TaxID=433684 RepID=UPI002544B53B|nr:sal-like protein 3 [Takifugu flavidus]